MSGRNPTTLFNAVAKFSTTKSTMKNQHGFKSSNSKPRSESKLKKSKSNADEVGMNYDWDNKQALRSDCTWVFC